MPWKSPQQLKELNPYLLTRIDFQTIPSEKSGCEMIESSPSHPFYCPSTAFLKKVRISYSLFGKFWSLKVIQREFQVPKLTEPTVAEVMS